MSELTSEAHFKNILLNRRELRFALISTSVNHVGMPAKISFNRDMPPYSAAEADCVIFSIASMGLNSLGDFVFKFQRTLREYKIGNFLIFHEGRFYLQRKLIHDPNILLELEKIPWLTNVHRSAGIVSDSGSTQIIFHRDSLTKHGHLSKCTFQVVDTFKGDSDTIGSAFSSKIDGQPVLLTCEHVVKAARGNLLVVDSNGNRRNVKVTYRSKSVDVALLEFTDDLRSVEHALEIGREDLLEVDDKVFVCGYPKRLGGTPTLSSGHVSKLDAEFDNGNGYIQISGAAINPNNSGGPVTDSFGRVLGMLTMRGAKDDRLQNISFAEPIGRVIEILRSNGKFKS